ncbi:MAG: efflux RND transporter periplasmic adaptor subunit [Thermoanaerobaculia bacterium]
MAERSKTLLWLGIGAVALAVLLIPRLMPAGEEEVADPAAEAATLTVEVKQMQPGPMVERLATTGTLQADEQVQIRSEIAGVVEAIRFDEGVRVEKGRLLVQLDDEQLEAERDRARFRVDLARQREIRQQDLLAQGLISQDDYDTALSQLNVLEAELRLAEAQLGKTRISAPFDGLIGFRFISVGAAITPQTPIATLQRVDPIKVQFAVPERYASEVRVGETVHFRVKGSEEHHEGLIYAIEPTVDQETRSLRARARSANPDGSLLPGSFADVELTIREIPDALTVPAIAVIPELGGKKVFVVEDGQAVPRFVETGIRTDTEVQIVRGLEPDERVIVSGVQQLVPGAPVVERAAESAQEVAP